MTGPSCRRGLERKCATGPRWHLCCRRTFDIAPTLYQSKIEKIQNKIINLYNIIISFRNVKSTFVLFAQLLSPPGQGTVPLVLLPEIGDKNKEDSTRQQQDELYCWSLYRRTTNSFYQRS